MKLEVDRNACGRQRCQARSGKATGYLDNPSYEQCGAFLLGTSSPRTALLQSEANREIGFKFQDLAPVYGSILTEFLEEAGLRPNLRILPHPSLLLSFDSRNLDLGSVNSEPPRAGRSGTCAVDGENLNANVRPQ